MKALTCLLSILLLVIGGCNENKPTDPDISQPSEPFLLVYSSPGVYKVSLDGQQSLFWDGYADGVEVLGNNIYILSEGTTVRIFNWKGELQSTTYIDIGSTHVVNFSVLPNGGFALFDNSSDKIYFTNSQGDLLHTTNIVDPSDNHGQNCDGIVVNNNLVFSETGNKELLKISLSTYDRTIFKDFSDLTSWLGAIDYSEGFYYLCQSTSVYRFTETSGKSTIANLPDANMTGIVIYGLYAYITSNSSDEIYKLNISTGEYTVIVSNINYPSDIELFE